MKETLRNAGVFVLPSRFEPWGVVVHEMAAAGFPMILSDAVGAATQFLQSGSNGFLFRNEDANDLKEALRKVMQLSGAELIKMAEASHRLGLSHSPALWADFFNRVVNRAL